MNTPLFLVFSIIEWSALIILSFSLFMFQIRDSVVTIIFSSILLSLLSFVLRKVSDLTMVSMFVQLITLFLIFWLMVRIPAIYAGIMATSGYVAYVFIQTLILLVINLITTISLDEIFTIDYMQYLIALFTTLVSFSICWLIIRLRFGFTFVPDHSIVKISFWEYIRFLFVIILGTLALGIYLFSAEHGFLQWVFMAMAVVLGLLLYLLFKKEAEQ